MAILRNRAARGLGVGLGLLAMTACAGIPETREDKIAVGTVAGAVVGGVAGYYLLGSGSGQWVAAMLGAAGGAVGGYFATERLTQWDRRMMREKAYDALSNAPAGETVSWQNPDTGTAGSMTPLRTYMDESGRLCRDYYATLRLEGEDFTAAQSACRMQTGAWVVG